MITTLSRTLTFVHPLSNNMVGSPKEARTTKHQVLRRYGDFGMTLENTTIVQDVPYADTFQVHDVWRITKQEEVDNKDSCCILQVYFAPVFTKRTMFKNIIERSIRTGTKEWFEGYIDMLQEALQEKGTIQAAAIAAAAAETTIDAETAAKRLAEQKEKESIALQKWIRSTFYLIAFGVFLVAVILVLFVVQLVAMLEAISVLKQEAINLKLENAQIFEALQQCSAVASSASGA